MCCPKCSEYLMCSDMTKDEYCCVECKHTTCKNYPSASSIQRMKEKEMDVMHNPNKRRYNPLFMR